MIRLILVFLVFCLYSCGANEEKTTNNEPLTPSSKEVSINVTSLGSTRTSLDEQDMATVQWESDDLIYIWSSGDAGASYNLEAAEFCLKYFSATYSEAIFTSQIEAMEEGEYLYFGVYPKPTTVEGSSVTYLLPAAQNGTYDGTLDLMAANPTIGGALSEETDKDLALSFRHLTHAIRINIPEGRNLFGNPIKELQVEFPSEVVGTLKFDASILDASTTISEGEQSVSLLFDEPFDEGDQYAWIFISPTQLTGELSFKAFDSYGFFSESISVSVDKYMEAGRITPITLTVPSGRQRTVITLAIEENYLGEPIETIQIDAPSGALFADGSSSITLPYSADNEYSVGYYTDEYGAAFKAGALAITFESEHAIVSGDDVALSDVIDNEVNARAIDIPYLYSTDFSAISSSGSLETKTSDLPGMTGWVAGNRSQWWEGTCVAVRNYSYPYVGPYDSRMNSATLSSFGLKEDVTTDIKVIFNSDWNANKSTSMNLIVGKSTDTSLDSEITGSEILMMSDVDVSQTGEFTLREVTVTECEGDYRIVWKTNGSNGSAGFTGAYDPVYIDNVKLQISK